MVPYYIEENKVLSTKDLTFKATSERVGGYIEGRDALEQAIYRILMTERYGYAIFGFNYGAELGRVMGMGKVKAKAVLPGIIREALLQDDRIEEVGEFEFWDADRTSLGVRFKAESIYGELEEEVIVNAEQVTD